MGFSFGRLYGLAQGGFGEVGVNDRWKPPSINYAARIFIRFLGCNFLSISACLLAAT